MCFLLDSILETLASLPLHYPLLSSLLLTIDLIFKLFNCCKGWDDRQNNNGEVETRTAIVLILVVYSIILCDII